MIWTAYSQVKDNVVSSRNLEEIILSLDIIGALRVFLNVLHLFVQIYIQNEIDSRVKNAQNESCYILIVRSERLLCL